MINKIVFFLFNLLSLYWLSIYYSQSFLLISSDSLVKSTQTPCLHNARLCFKDWQNIIPSIRSLASQSKSAPYKVLRSCVPEIFERKLHTRAIHAPLTAYFNLSTSQLKCSQDANSNFPTVFLQKRLLFKVVAMKCRYITLL